MYLSKILDEQMGEKPEASIFLHLISFTWLSPTASIFLQMKQCRSSL